MTADRDRLAQLRRELQPGHQLWYTDARWLLGLVDALGTAMGNLLLAIENGDSCYEDPEYFEGFLGRVIPESHPAYVQAEAILEALGLEPDAACAGEQEARDE